MIATVKPSAEACTAFTLEPQTEARPTKEEWIEDVQLAVAGRALAANDVHDVALAQGNAGVEAPSLVVVLHQED